MTDKRTAPVETDQGDEWVPEDDAIIGKAFRWSLVVFLLIGIAIGATIWQLRKPPTATAPRENVFVAPRSAVKSASAPSAVFTDITEAAGIDFVRENGANGDKLLPETMGGGCAFLDYDNDGDQDILLVNGMAWPGDPMKLVDGAPPTAGLYQNDGSGRFRNVTKGSGLDVPLMGMGTAVGDYDGDGDIDILITCVGQDHLFRNEGGRFEDVTADAGVGGDPGGWSIAAGFFDSDNDGDLDLFVSHYIKWSREIDFAVDYRLTGVGRAYGVPTNFEGAHSYLYVNNGDGTFADRSEEAGIHVVNPATGVPVGKALGLCFVDIDLDGLTDILVANDTVQNFLFRNKGGNHFEEVGAETGVAFDAMGNSTGAMGIDAADYRNGGPWAVAIGNFANEMTSFYVSGEDRLSFTDMAVAEGVGGPSRSFLKFGVFFFDFDLDGRLDLLECNGHLEEEINKVQPSQRYEQPAQLFWNAGPEGRSCYSEVPRDQLGDLGKPIVGRGASYADVDGDGDLDVLLTQARGRPMLLRNDQKQGNHWLRIQLSSRRGNTPSLGAVVELSSGGVTQRRCVSPTRSYASQVELPVTFGLGATSAVDRLEVRWPDQQLEQFPVAEVDRMMTVRQGDGGPGKLARIR